MKRPNFANHPHDEFWTNGTSVIANDVDGEPVLLCECVSEHTAKGIADVLNYHNHVATMFCYGSQPPKLKIVGKAD
jgi:hypothetical protein